MTKAPNQIVGIATCSSLRRQSIWTALFLLFVLPANARQVDEWTGAELLNRGAVGMTDMLSSLETMRYWSVDRFSAHFLDAGMGGAHASGPTVLVNGMPMSSEFLGRTTYNLIPLVSSDVLTMRRKTGLSFLPNGELSDGQIQITTSDPIGFSVRGSVGLTNETGDPGPALYSNPSAKNVDRSGPIADLRMSWGNKNWFLQAAYDLNSYHLTDARIEGRIWRVFAGYQKPIFTQSTPNFRLKYTSDRTNVQAWMGKTVAEVFLFDEVAGRDWPHREEHTWFSVYMSHSLVNGLDAELRSGYRKMDTQNMPAQINLPRSLRQSHAYVEGKMIHRLSSATWYAAVGSQQIALSQHEAPAISGRQTAFVRWGGDLSLSSASSFSLRSGLRSPLKNAFEPSKWSHYYLLEFNRGQSGGNKLNVSASISTNFAPSVGTMTGLIQAGVSFDEWAPDVTPPPLSIRGQAIELAFSRSTLARPNLLLWISVRARLLSGLTLPSRMFTKDYSAYLFDSPTTYKIGQTGRVVSPSLGFEWKQGRSTTRISYQYQRLIARGNLYFWKNFVGLAPHFVSGSFLFTPTPRLHLFASARIASSAIWPEYDANNQPRQQSLVQVEGTVSKQLWEDNLRLSLSFLNMLDQTTIRHPAAVDEQFAVRLSVWVGFSDTHHSNVSQSE